MIEPQWIRAGDCPERPWKNGGGTTQEIAVYPPEAGMDDFVWRLSLARVDAAGPFSAFPDVDRVLAALEGEVHLAGPGIDIRLSPESAPFAFDGGAPVLGTPLGGPMRDCNAMARRERCRLSLERHARGEARPAPPTRPGETLFLIALAPQRLYGRSLAPLDVLRFDGPPTPDDTGAPPPEAPPLAAPIVLARFTRTAT